MILIFDGKSEIGAQVERNLSYWTCLRHLFRSSAVTNRVFLSEKTYFFHACAAFSELPSDISTVYRTEEHMELIIQSLCWCI